MRGGYKRSSLQDRSSYGKRRGEERELNSISVTIRDDPYRNGFDFYGGLDGT